MSYSDPSNPDSEGIEIGRSGTKRKQTLIFLLTVVYKLETKCCKVFVFAAVWP